MIGSRLLLVFDSTDRPLAGYSYVKLGPFGTLAYRLVSAAIHSRWPPLSPN